MLVLCSDEVVREAVSAWLEAMELTPPAPLVFDVRVGGHIPDVPPAEPLFTQPEIEIYREADTGATVLSWDRAPAVATISPDVATATVHLSEEAASDIGLCSRFFLSSVLIFLARRVGWHHVHAATWVDPRGRGWLVAGDRHVGKSTTTALYASCGWTVGADDVVFLTKDGEGVTTVAKRGPIALREGGRKLLGRIGGVFQADRAKTLFDPEELGGAWIQEIRPEILLFSTVGNDVTTLEDVRPADVLAELVRWSAWVILEPSLAQRHLDLLASLGRQTRSYRVHLGTDLFSNPELLMDLIP